jgi:L-rhamnose-H+ transport protein
MYLGLLLAAIGGASDASLAFVMGLANRWRWENIWLVWAIFGCLVFPWVTVFLLVRDPSPLEVYRHVSSDALARAMIFGAGWGVGAILFGLGVVRVGMGLGLGVVVSLTAAIGALLPLVQNHREMLLTAQAGMIYLAVGLLIVGIVLCAVAAHRRKEEKPLLEREQASFFIGIVYCILSGVTSPMINLAFTAGIEISHQAEALGASALGAGIAPVAPIMTAGFVVNAVYCMYLLSRHRGWSDFAQPDAISHWFYGIVMGLLQMTGFLLYTIAASRIDKSTELGGTVLGWPVYTACAILTGNLEGLLRGEWRGSDHRTLVLLFVGLAVLITSSVVVVSLGSYLATMAG